MMPLIQPFPPGLTVPPPIEITPAAPAVAERPVPSDYAKLRDRRKAIMVSIDRTKAGSRKRTELIERLRDITSELLKMEMRRP